MIGKSVVFVLSALALAGCSSSSSPSGAGSDGGSGGGTNVVCSKIPVADVQALTPNTVQPATDSGIGECVWHNSGEPVQVDYYPQDNDKSSYMNLSNGNDHAISGIGDEAYWNEAVDGKSAPQLSARKGTTTCVIQSNDPPDTTMKVTQNGATYTVTDADALAYVQLMGKVCNDVFALTN